MITQRPKLRNFSGVARVTKNKKGAGATKNTQRFGFRKDSGKVRKYKSGDYLLSHRSNIIGLRVFHF